MAKRDVGERADGHDPDVVVRGIEQKAHGIVAGRRALVFDAIHPAQTVGAVNAAGVDGLAHQRLGGAHMHGRVHIEEGGSQQGVVGDRIQRRVAAHGSDAEYLRVAMRENDGDGVVVAWVAIDD